MHAIQPKQSDAGDKCTPNILPCRLNHNGPVNASKRYWAPEVDADGKNTSYFRGRKLYGRTVKVPEGYKGVVLSATDRTLHQNNGTDGRTADGRTDALEEDDDDDETEPVKVLEEVASFEEIVVWGHETVPESDDPYVKGVEEWIAFAEAMHSPGSDSSDKPRSKES